jgi:hypothetical protein
MCQQATRIECSTAPSAFLWPRRGRRRAYLRGEVSVLGAGRGEGGLFERPVQPLAAVAVRPERRLPADSWLPGHCPAHDASSLAEGKMLMSIPISAMIASGRCAVERRGSCTAAQRPSRKGDLLGDHLGQARDLLIEEVDVREDRCDPQRVHAIKAALKRLAQRGDLLAQPAPRGVGQHRGIDRDRHERVEHCPAGHPEDVGGDAVKLDGRVLCLVQPVGLAGAFPGSASCCTAELNNVSLPRRCRALHDVRDRAAVGTEGQVRR